MCRLTEPDVDAEDLYKVLGVQRGATDKDICAAYKRLALRYHPDKNLDNREQAEHAFKRVTCAYETLRDTSKRQQYESSRVTSHGPLGGNSGIYGDIGSLDRADELYRVFFGGSSSTPNIDIAGIFDFDRKPRTKLSKAADRPTKYTMPSGTAVVVHGLASKPEHNGKSGHIREWNAEKSRYDVSLNSGGILSLRPQNLAQLCHITVAGHENRPEINGKKAEIIDFNEESGQYMLLLDDPASVIEVPPRNCIFAVGTAAILQGLSDEQLNGQMCTIVSVDQNASRYVVECEGGRQLKVRFERIMC